MALLSAILRNANHQVFCFDLNNSLYCSGPEEYQKFWDDKDLYTFWSNFSLLSKPYILNSQNTLKHFISQKIGCQ